MRALSPSFPHSWLHSDLGLVSRVHVLAPSLHNRTVNRGKSVVAEGGFPMTTSAGAVITKGEENLPDAVLVGKET